VPGALLGEQSSALALAILTNIQEPFTHMVAFLDTFYLELTSVANFPKDSAWELIGRCVGAVFVVQASAGARVPLLQEL
jgi:hypothetical protein